ncbi:hypothetical protein COCON_G00038790 [Conger conger]|uniref:Secreted protein n=1 Tax=Conger conger TaxID=82655 RepID=A0A9Q1I731_CONCO|nr:hypothetical protein COCON_G00038790 [Conger conger]
MATRTRTMVLASALVIFTSRAQVRFTSRNTRLMQRNSRKQPSLTGSGSLLEPFQFRRPPAP